MSDQTDAKDAEILPAESPAITVPTKPDEILPTTVLALPLNQRPVFPTMMVPLLVPAGRLADTILAAISDHRSYLGFFMTTQALEDGTTFTPEQLNRQGALARILRHQVADNGAIQVFVQVVARFTATAFEVVGTKVLARGEAVRPSVDANVPEVRACAMAIVTALKDLVSHNPVFADEIRMVLANFNNLDGPSRLADLAATVTTASREELQAILETAPVVPRMEKVLQLLAKETALAQLKSKISQQLDQKVSDNQRKFFLSEQLKIIKQELGLETDDKSHDLKKLTDAVAAKEPHLSAEAKQVISEELRKLGLLEPHSAEYGVTRARLEWLVDLPWGVETADVFDLGKLRQGLDTDHFGLDEVKDRIVEFVAVRSLQAQKKEAKGATGKGGIICLVGPPGTGKTSVGESIARQLGRKFYRFSLGGMRDEAEIKGHRRTYVGALPGKPVQALKRSGAMNPVILLDEIDKLAHGMQGDPAAALLEVLDPAQNHDFLDHYLDIRVDLSKVLFICTANDLAGIPEALRDRLEIIRLAGYVEVEKLAIAKDHLLPRQLEAHGLTPKQLHVGTPALRTLIRDYARESGVRQLDQQLAKLCRKVATAQVQGATPAPEKVPAKKSAKGAVKKVAITPADLERWLGKPLMRDDALLDRPVPGVVTGLAWTSMGGATLEIEAVGIPAEKGGLTLSGQLGDVMKESAGLARSWLMANAGRLGVAKGWFDTHQIHLHVPAGATPKDGPSAGITMATALLSLALGKPVRKRLGMTGELTLTGRVFPIGGVREKLVAAKRSGLELVLLPKANERDYTELPELVREGIEVRFVSRLDEVLVQVGLAKG